MTPKQYKVYRANNEALNNGQLLNKFIRSLLENAKDYMTLVQVSSLGNISSSSDFSPTDDSLYKHCIETIQLVSDGKYDTLISLLKRLPEPPNKSAHIKQYINGLLAPQADWYNADVVIGVRSTNEPEILTPMMQILKNSELKIWLKAKAQMEKEGSLLSYKYFNSNYEEATPLSDEEISALWTKVANEPKIKDCVFTIGMTSDYATGSLHSHRPKPLPIPVSKANATLSVVSRIDEFGDDVIDADYAEVEPEEATETVRRNRVITRE